MGLQTEENKELSEKLGKIVSKNPSKWIEESNERARIKQIEKDKEMIDFGLWLTKKGNYNINNWNKTMAEMLETYKKEK